MFRSIPAQHQTDAAKAPGQSSNPVGQTESALRRIPKSGSLAEYIAQIQAAEALALFKAASRRLVGESA